MGKIQAQIFPHRQTDSQQSRIFFTVSKETGEVVPVHDTKAYGEADVQLH
jgi:hypothetical protein